MRTDGCTKAGHTEIKGCSPFLGRREQGRLYLPSTPFSLGEAEDQRGSGHTAIGGAVVPALRSGSDALNFCPSQPHFCSERQRRLCLEHPRKPLTFAPRIQSLLHHICCCLEVYTVSAKRVTIGDIIPSSQCSEGALPLSAHR